MSKLYKKLAVVLTALSLAVIPLESAGALSVNGSSGSSYSSSASAYQDKWMPYSGTTGSSGSAYEDNLSKLKAGFGVGTSDSTNNQVPVGGTSSGSTNNQVPVGGTSSGSTNNQVPVGGTSYGSTGSSVNNKVSYATANFSNVNNKASYATDAYGTVNNKVSYATSNFSNLNNKVSYATENYGSVNNKVAYATENYGGVNNKVAYATENYGSVNNKVSYATENFGDSNEVNNKVSYATENFDNNDVDNKVEYNSDNFDENEPEQTEDISLCQNRPYPRDIDGHWSEIYVRRLYDLCVVEGYEDGNFRPNANVTRAELVKMGLFANGIEPNNGCYDNDCGSPFNDLDTWQGKWVRPAYDRGIIEGYVYDTFRPNQAITRAEAVKVVLATYGYSPTGDSKSFFNDVHGWSVGWVERARLIGLVQGIGNGNFDPDRPITRAEAAKIVAKMIEYWDTSVAKDNANR